VIIVVLCDNVLQAKQMLKDGIDRFIEEKILFAAKAISEDACLKIRDGDVILVYSRLLLCLHLLLSVTVAGQMTNLLLDPIYRGTTSTDVNQFNQIWYT